MQVDEHIVACRFLVFGEVAALESEIARVLDLEVLSGVGKTLHYE